MAIKLDDFLSKKKEPAQVLDLSKVKISTKEEFRKYFDKIPEYKIKPEKVMPETIKIRDKDFSFTPGRREERQTHDWSYPDPTPPDMKTVKLQDLCPVNIDWKMLTTLRPKTKVEEDMFSRLVQLGKLDLKYQQNLKREKDTDWIRRTKNPRSSIVETRVLSCKECGEDLCDGSLCCKLMYENFFRMQALTATGVVKDSGGLEGGEEKKKKKRKKRKGRKRTKSKVRRRKPRKNSIFNRPLSRGCSRDHSRRNSQANVAERVRAQSAIRAASLSRSRSRERRPSEASEPSRARSAPRIQFKSDIESAGPSKFSYQSDSGPSPTDYSSQSETESGSYKLQSSLKVSSRRARSRVMFNSRQNDTEQYPRKRFVRECTLSEYRGHHSDVSGSGAETQDSDTDSCSPSRSTSPEKVPTQRVSLRRPSTIQIEFDELAQAGCSFQPAKSYLPTKFTGSTGTGGSRKNDATCFATLRNQEVTRIMEGFSKIELGFTGDAPLTATPPQSRVRPPGLQRGARARPKTSLPTRTPSSYLKGKALLAKPPP